MDPKNRKASKAVLFEGRQSELKNVIQLTRQRKTMKEKV